MALLSRALWSLSVLAGSTGWGCAPFNPAGNAPGQVILTSPSPVARLAGVVSIQDVPVAGAQIQVFDMASGRVVPILASDEAAWRTNAEGRFDLLIPAPLPAQVLKVMALTESGAWLSLVDGNGNGLAPSNEPHWRLQQDSLVVLRLTPGTTAAAQMMEGPLQLQFRLPVALRDAAVARLWRATNDLLDELETALNEEPFLSRHVIANVDAQGRARNPRVLSTALNAFNQLDAWSQHIVEAVIDFSRQVDVFVPFAELERGLAALDPGSFPIGQLSRETDGTFRYTDVQGRLIDGVLIQDAPGLEPAPAPPTPVAPSDVIPELQPAFDPGAESLAAGGLNITDGNLIDPVASEGVL